MLRYLAPLLVLSLIGPGCGDSQPPPPQGIASATRTSAGEYYVCGNVGAPGAYSLTGRTVTLRQALIAAGPRIDPAAGTRVHLQRRTAGNREDRYDISATTIYTSPVGETLIQADDVVCYGTTSPTNCYPAGVRRTITVP